MASKDHKLKSILRSATFRYNWIKPIIIQHILTEVVLRISLVVDGLHGPLCSGGLLYSPPWHLPARWGRLARVVPWCLGRWRVQPREHRWGCIGYTLHKVSYNFWAPSKFWFIKFLLSIQRVKYELLKIFPTIYVFDVRMSLFVELGEGNVSQ